jgi:hypothetical protein
LLCGVNVLPPDTPEEQQTGAVGKGPKASRHLSDWNDEQIDAGPAQAVQLVFSHVIALNAPKSEAAAIPAQTVLVQL